MDEKVRVKTRNPSPPRGNESLESDEIVDFCVQLGWWAGRIEQRWNSAPEARWGKRSFAGVLAAPRVIWDRMVGLVCL